MECTDEQKADPNSAPSAQSIANFTAAFGGFDDLLEALIGVNRDRKNDLCFPVGVTVSNPPETSTQPCFGKVTGRTGSAVGLYELCMADTISRKRRRGGRFKNSAGCQSCYQFWKQECYQNPDRVQFGNKLFQIDLRHNEFSGRRYLT